MKFNNVYAHGICPSMGTESKTTKGGTFLSPFLAANYDSLWNALSTQEGFDSIDKIQDWTFHSFITVC